MQISRVETYGVVRNNISRVKQNSINNISFSSRDIFEKKKPSTYARRADEVIKYDLDGTSYSPKAMKLNILNGDEAHLKDIAESFCMYSNKYIECVTQIPFFLIGTSKSKSKKAYDRLMPYIAEQRAKILHLRDVKKALIKRAGDGPIPESDQNIIIRIDKELNRLNKKNALAKEIYMRDWDTLDKKEEDQLFSWD